LLQDIAGDQLLSYSAEIIHSLAQQATQAAKHPAQQSSPQQSTQQLSAVPYLQKLNRKHTVQN